MGPEAYLRCKVYVKITEVDILALAEDENRRIEVGIANTDVDEMRIYHGIKRRCQEVEDEEDIKNGKVQSEACNKVYMLARRNMTFKFINTDGGWKAMAKVASSSTVLFNTIVEPFLNKWLSGENAKYSEKAQARRKDGRPSLIMFKYIWPTGEVKDDAERYNLLAPTSISAPSWGKWSTSRKKSKVVDFLRPRMYRSSCWTVSFTTSTKTHHRRRAVTVGVADDPLQYLDPICHSPIG
ncbi:hypothetical protein BV898_01732 [Hypsibius exemplaris]|uniref:Uncharacterized protein n=1 Tax=Hypsibius exemplaris TaxID=2072580 RepID=A0A1W0XAZ3_HYPEX|nr:hypothetical protein BV898_01732 [Hypsibius exemplaris]